MSRKLVGKTVLITGGTSQLGRCFVKQAELEGAQVYFTYSQNEALAKLLEAPAVQSYRLDLSDMRAIDRFSSWFQDKTANLDGLVHNAAAIRDHKIQNLSEADWDYVMTVNLKAPFYLTRSLLPLLSKKSPGKILMLISRLAQTGGAGTSNYASAKAGLVSLVQSFARELGKKGILVNAVNPGFMQSGMTHDLPEDIVRKNLELNPLKNFSNPEEVADFLVYLLSDRVTQVTGQVFHFDSRMPA